MGSGVGLFGDLPHHKYTKYKAVIGTINAGITNTNFNKEKGSTHANNLQRTGQRGLGKGARRKYIFSRYHIKIAKRLFQYFEIRTRMTVNFIDFKA